MKFNALAVLILAVGLFISRDKLVAVMHWETTPTDFFKEGQCKGKKLCGVAYLVPKSRATHAILPELQKYMERAKTHPEYGVQVIVGRGKTSEENTEKAKKVGEGVIVDPPSFFVIDQQNETKLVGKAAWGWFRASFGR